MKKRKTTARKKQFADGSIVLQPNIIAQGGDEIVNSIVEKWLAGRKRKRNVHEKKMAVRCIIGNGQYADRAGLFLRLPRGVGHYSIPRRYGYTYWTYETMTEAMDILADMGILKITQNGHYDRETHSGKMTRAIYDDLFIQETSTAGEKMESGTITGDSIDFRENITIEKVFYESIILRDSNKKPISYTDGTITNGMRRNLEVINAVPGEVTISRQDITSSLLSGSTDSTHPIRHTEEKDKIREEEEEEGNPPPFNY